jgi:glycosyltransferase involved in cell wall biosynthesis
MRDKFSMIVLCIIFNVDVDDGSTDTTATLVQEFASRDSRIRYLYQTNQGQPVARNTGLQDVRGEYVQFLDADDILEPEKLFYQADFLDRNQGIGIVYGEARYFTNEKPERLLVNRWGHAEEKWMPGVSGRGPELIKLKRISKKIFLS